MKVTEASGSNHVHPGPALSEPEISPASVAAQLQRILASTPFAQSERMCRFLRMVVEYSLENRDSELKEYPIGLQVFDRKAAFDPRSDPIVRVEARRLRGKLADYYENEGSGDEILIELPKGAYSVKFSRKGRANGPMAPVPPQPAPDSAAVAVMPFANLTPGEENQYFSDGLTQELILGLTRVSGLRVVAWTSAAQLRGEQDFEAVGKRLKVGTVLTGSIRAAGERVRVTAQLISTADSSYLWTEAYDRQVCDLLQIQDEISRSIVDTLRLRLTGRLSYSGQRPAGWNEEALNLYFKGRFEWNRRTTDSLRRSVVLLERAVHLEPAFALGWAGLADSFTLLADYGITNPEDSMPRAKRAALRAIELDPDLGEAWNSLALVVGIYEWEHDEAERCYRRCIQLNPGYSTVHHWYAVDHLVMLGRFEEAEAEIALARQLDPWSTIIIEGVAFVQMLQSCYDEAIATSREALAINPDFYKSWTSIGRTLIQKGQHQEAIEMLEKGRTLGGDMPNILGALGQAHALLGNRAKAHEFLTQLRHPPAGQRISGVAEAIIYIGLGEQEMALDALERACERRETALIGLKVHPVYDCLRDSPRFQALLRRTRFA
jgi:TolB-like protein/Tfp pilus assembly protein PilF